MTNRNNMLNPLIPWIEQKTDGMPLWQYQLEKLRETVRYAKENSPFYKEHLKEICPDEIREWRDVECLPLMDARDLIERGSEILCARPNEIERIVTLRTSGTTGAPKRVYFTKSDQELTIDFFHHGMQCLIEKNDRFLILLPCSTPGSVGDLLSHGLKRLGCKVYAYGLQEDLIKTAAYMHEHKITSLVANPVYALKLAEIGKAGGKGIRLASVLLSTDYVPDAIGKRLSAIWGCKVYEHYGMTEMGFGGGVFCRYGKGYHMREADFYFEIISPDGRTVPDGEYGEVVFTTLTRQGMPLIRYKTGDIGRFHTQSCDCGKTLKLMEKIKRRADGAAFLKNGRQIWMDELDEVIFAHIGVTDYQAKVIDGELTITIFAFDHNTRKTSDSLVQEVRQSLTDYAGVEVIVELRAQETVFKGSLCKRVFMI